MNNYIRYLIRLAQNGDSDSQNKLGIMYYTGKEVQKDYQEALKWFEKSARQGHKNAQYNLGFMYYCGIGVEQDYTKAEEWWKKGAISEYTECQELLAVMYLFGLGDRVQNIEEAEKLFTRSLENGNKKCKYYVETLNKIKNKNKIKIIENISEFDEKNCDDIEGIIVKPKNNFYYYSHTLYDIDTINKIKSKINEFLEDIPLVKFDKSNEFDVFEQICKKIARLIVFDKDIIEFRKCKG